MKSETKPEEKKGLMLRPTAKTRAFLDKKKRETGIPISSWVMMLIIEEMKKEDAARLNLRGNAPGTLIDETTLDEFISSKTQTNTE